MLNFTMTFKPAEKEIGIFFNNNAAITSMYKLQKSSVKDVNLAVYKTKVVGMTFNTTKVTNYKTISDFFVDKLHVKEDDADIIMQQIVKLSGTVNVQEISDTIH